VKLLTPQYEQVGKEPGNTRVRARTAVPTEQPRQQCYEPEGLVCLGRQSQPAEIGVPTRLETLEATALRVVCGMIALHVNKAVHITWADL
jgi:hypothetical protein